MSKRTLLLADDSITIQKVVNLTFADEGIDVITVGDGDAAMQKISEAVPDVVLADVHMPGLSGYRICEILRENPETKDLPVILLVGSFEPFDEGEAARVGANAYLTKPFQSIRQLVSQVTALMESSDANNSSRPVEEETPPQREPETNDIEALYDQSFGEPEATPTEPGPPRYVDAGMDDEMIETSHTGDEAEVPLWVEPVFADMSHSGEGAARAFESFADMAEEEEPVAAAAAAPDTIRNFDQFSRSEPPTIAETSPRTSEFTLDELELLELPPMDNGKTIESPMTVRVETEDAIRQVVDLSPEQMEIIVRKVVEKLSEK